MRLEAEGLHEGLHRESEWGTGFCIGITQVGMCRKPVSVKRAVCMFFSERPTADIVETPFPKLRVVTAYQGRCEACLGNCALRVLRFALSV